MDAHEMFDEIYDLFLEEIYRGVQSIYASKFCEGIGN